MVVFTDLSIAAFIAGYKELFGIAHLSLKLNTKRVHLDSDRATMT